MKKILFLFGPNLDQTAFRDSTIYGGESFEDHKKLIDRCGQEINVDVECFQSASEADLVSKIHGARLSGIGAIVINAGAFTHYAWALRDALELTRLPVVEVHLSKVASREPWRHVSVISPVASGYIAGFGSSGYEMALKAAADLVEVAH